MSAYVYPDRGREASVAAALLGCAQSPYHVQTNTDSGLAFVVPDYLADAYEAQQQADAEPEPDPPAPTDKQRAPRTRTRKAA